MKANYAITDISKFESWVLNIQAIEISGEVINSKFQGTAKVSLTDGTYLCLEGDLSTNIFIHFGIEIVGENETEYFYEIEEPNVDESVKKSKQRASQCEEELALLMDAHDNITHKIFF